MISPQHRFYEAKGNVIMMPTGKNRNILRVEDVATLLDISPRTVRVWFTQWQDSGGQEGLPGYKIGKSWRADRAEIYAWINQRKVQSSQAVEMPLRKAR